MSIYIVPVPIGNLKDITLRAIEILKEVDFIIAEDTRYSLKLLNYFGIKKSIISYYKPCENKKAEKILSLLKTKKAALITDSGTPLISDPGFILIKKVIENGVEIIPLPGPTAFVPAIVASGIDPSKFIFLGFSPRKKGELIKYLKTLAYLEYTLVFYESPRRVENFLIAALSVFGNRRFAVVKEISKKNEKIIRGKLIEFAKIIESETILGEIVIIIEGNFEKNKKEKALKITSRDDIFEYFKEKHNISKNDLKKILIKKNK